MIERRVLFPRVLAYLGRVTPPPQETRYFDSEGIEVHDPECNLSPNEMGMLATYNAERHRGLVHSEAWKERMNGLQARFNRNP